MAQSGLSSCVQSIISSFSSGLDIFKRFREVRKCNKGRMKKQSIAGGDEELQLAASLRKGPEDIRREYQQSVSAVGEHFARGDAVANTALAEVLLKLNTGLVNVINVFLARDSRKTQLDYRSLTALSDSSRVETCRALRKLYRRMLLSGTKTSQRISISDDRPSPRRGPTSKRTRAPGPVLARVVIADSSKRGQVAMVRPGGRSKGKSTMRSSSGQSSKPQYSTTLAPPSSTPPSTYREHVLLPSAQQKSVDQFTSMVLSSPKPRRKLSATVANSSIPALLQSKSTHQSQCPCEAPVTARTTEPRRLDKPTPTYCSEASDMTKLGEIPLHRWAEPVDFDAMSRLNKEAVRDGWPFHESDEIKPKKSKGGIFKLFRRKTADA